MPWYFLKEGCEMVHNNNKKSDHYTYAIKHYYLQYSNRRLYIDKTIIHTSYYYSSITMILLVNNEIEIIFQMNKQNIFHFFLSRISKSTI